MKQWVVTQADSHEDVRLSQAKCIHYHQIHTGCCLPDILATHRLSRFLQL